MRYNPEDVDLILFDNDGKEYRVNLLSVADDVGFEATISERTLTLDHVEIH